MCWALLCDIIQGWYLLLGQVRIKNSLSEEEAVQAALRA